MVKSHATIARGKSGVIGPSGGGSAPRLIYDIRRWLEDFSAAVRARDYDGGRALFADEVYAFGSRAPIMDGIDELVRHQWQPTWSSTSGYRFDLEQLCCGGEGTMAWAAVPWQSQGSRADGTGFDRRGRATFILQRTAGGWRAVHSHHSLEPR